MDGSFSSRKAINSPMLLRLLFRALAHRPAKLFAVIAALGVGATLSSALLSLFFDLPAKMSAEFRALGPNLVIAPQDDATTLPQETLVSATSLAPGATALPWLYAVGSVNQSSRQSSLVLAGTDLGAIAQAHPSWSLVAFTPSSSPDFAAPGVIAGERVAAHFGWSAQDAAGQQVAMEYDGRSLRLPLRGIISTGGSEDAQVFVPLAALQELTERSGQLSLIEMAVPGEAAQVETARATLAQTLPHAAVRPLRPVIESQARVVMKVRGLMLGLTTIVLALVLLSVMTTVSGMVLDRSKEIGVMKALGAGEGRIAGFLFAEASLLALLASLAGFVAGYGLARLAAERLFGSGLAMRADAFAAVMTITVVVALLACALPARYIRGLEPAVILRGE